MVWDISTVGRTKFSEVRSTPKAVNGESAQNSPGIFGALAQLVARYIRIVEVTGSNPVCSTILEKSELNPNWGWVRISSFCPKVKPPAQPVEVKALAIHRTPPMVH